jgi:hypothetical protein
MMQGTNDIKERMDCRSNDIPVDVLKSSEPVVMRGLVADWPAVAGCSDASAAERYLGGFATEAPVTAYLTEPEHQGRYFYNDNMDGFNFKSAAAPLNQVLARLKAICAGEHEPQSIYVGSTVVDQWLPGFREVNDLGLAVANPLVSFWLGNQTRISAHYDFPDNIACVVAGHRRFTLFPPEHVDNLYVGPLEMTPSGQAISLVDFAHPDLQRFPKFATALEHARVVELAPGDAVFIPSMWWHHVESQSELNLLVNYWWCDSLPELGSPTGALLHAMLAIRDLPPHQRKAWANLFNHYVFEADESTHDHIPEHARGCLSTFTQDSARRMRALLLNKLNQ